MPVLTVGHLKGGSGKSTTAVNVAAALAERGDSGVIIDADAQGSVSTWAAVRDADKPMPFSIVAAVRNTLHRDIADLQGDRTWAIIDTPSKTDQITLSAMLAADLVILPTRPSSYDLWALQRTVDKVEEARIVKPELKAVAVLTQCPVGSTLTGESKTIIDDANVPLMKTVQSSRVSYIRSADGITIFEGRDRKAQEETTALTNELLDYLNLNIKETD